MHVSCKAAATIGLILCGQLTMADNLLQNGSFEPPLSPDVAPGGAITLLGGQNLGGWAVTGESVDVHDTGHTNAKDGVQAVDLSGFDQAGGLQQTVTVNTDQPYVLDFWYAGHSHGSHTKRFTVSVAGQFRTFTIPASTDPQALNWTYSGPLEFEIGQPTGRANQVTVQVDFTSLVHNGGPIIDDVRLRAASALPDTQQGGACVALPYSDQARYNEVFLPTCHNCYEREHSDRPDIIDFADALSAGPAGDNAEAARVVEIDFWDEEDLFFGGGIPSYWYVRHDATGGNDNNCVGDPLYPTGLGACLVDVRDWLLQNPTETVTLALDKKQNWGGGGSGREPADLDLLVATIFCAYEGVQPQRATPGKAQIKTGKNAKGGLGCFGQDMIFRPSHMLIPGKTLRESARQGSWPTMAELAGKVVLMFNAGSLGSTSNNAAQSRYIDDLGSSGAIFMAVDTDEKRDIVGIPQQFNETSAQHVVFFNLARKDSRMASIVRYNNFVSRVWGQDSVSFCSITNRCANFDALYNWPDRHCNNHTTTGPRRGVLGLRRQWQDDKELAFGIDGAIAANTYGEVVEVHELGQKLYYHVGAATNSSTVNWGAANEYTTGITPAVAINDNGVVVEVHQSENNTGLWYRIGNLSIDSREQKGGRQISWWGSSTRYDEGRTPSVAINNAGHVVEVHAAQYQNDLWSNTGLINSETGAIDWISNRRYDRGREPSVALNSFGNVVEVHRSHSKDTLWYRSGQLNELIEVEFSNSMPFDTGHNPSVALLDDGTVFEVHQSPSGGRLWFHEGRRDNSARVTWGDSAMYDEGSKPSVTFANEKTVITTHKHPQAFAIMVRLGLATGQ